MVHPTRRTVLVSTLAAGAAGTLAASLPPAPAAAAPTPGVPRSPDPADPVDIRWLDGAAPAALAAGATWGVPWSRGTLAEDQPLTLTADDGASVPLQSWVTGWWPDGSVKWTAHAISDAAPRVDAYALSTGEPAQPQTPVTVTTGRRDVVVDTGPIQVTFATKGEEVITSIARNDQVIAQAGTLVASRQDAPSTDDPDRPKTERFTSHIDKVEVEQEGPVRAVVRVEGVHRKGGRS